MLRQGLRQGGRLGVGDGHTLKRGDVWLAEVGKSGIREGKRFGTKREAQDGTARRELEIAGVSMTGPVPEMLQALMM